MWAAPRDRRDVFEGHAEHVAEDKGQALGGPERLEDHHQRWADRVGQEELALHVRRLELDRGGLEGHVVFPSRSSGPQPRQALHLANKSIAAGGLPDKTLGLVHLRASQISNCGVCLDGHQHLAKKAGESHERLFTLSAWRETPYFIEPERAALLLREAVTRLSDREDAVPDAVWAEVRKHDDERQISALIMSISLTNVWNRLNVATRQIAGIRW